MSLERDFVEHGSPKHLALKDFPPFTASENDTPACQQIFRYLSSLLEGYQVKAGEEVFLPSLLTLSRFFETTHLEVHDAFQLLRKQGYDYCLESLDAAIRFWYTLHE